jgi:hypothetical protein
MDHKPTAELTPEQVQCALELRGIEFLDDQDLAAVTGLVAALRQQALGLRPSPRDGALAAGETA